MAGDELNEYVDQIVHVTLFDDTVHIGRLQFENEYTDRFGWKHHSYYHIGEQKFLSRHVKYINIVRG